MNRSRVTADLASHGNIFVDIANDRVGIGTTQPTHKVDLKGDLKIHDGSGYDNHITYVQNPPSIRFPTGPLANLGKTPYLGFGDRTSGGDFKIYHDHYNTHLKLSGLGGLYLSNQSTSGVIGIQGSNGSGSVNNSIHIPAGATAGVKLYQASELRFETVGYGVTVHGTTETQELNVTGVSTFNGNITGTGSLSITSAAPEIFLTDTNANSDYSIVVNGGQFRVRDETNSANRLAVNSDGHVDIYGRLDAVGGFVASSNSSIEGNLELTSTYPSLTWTDTNHNSDYRITNNDGQLIIYDITNGAHRLNVNADGHIDILGHLDVGAGIDVTGAITATGNLTISNGQPTINLTDTDANSDYKVNVNTGNFYLADTTNNQTRFYLTSDGTGFFQNNFNVAGDLTLTDTTADSAAGPEFKLFRNSASPANADYLGQIKFAGESSTGVERNYAKITGKILDVTNGAEDGIIEFAHIKNGSQVITGRFRSDSLQLLNSTNFSVAGTSEFTGAATFNEPLTLSKDANVIIDFSANSTSDARGIYFNSRCALSADYNDGYLRLNNQSQFSNGVYTPGVMRADGGFRVDSHTVVNSSGFIVASRIAGALPAIDGSNLTGISGVSVANQANNRLITATGTTDALNAETALTFYQSGNDSILTIEGTNSAGHAQLTLKTGGTTDHCSINFGDSADHDAGEIRYTNSSDSMNFDTAGAARMILDSSGNLYPNNDGDQSLGQSSNRWKNFFLRQGGQIQIGDATNTNFFGITEGLVNTYTDQDFMSIYYRGSMRFFSSNNNERVRIHSDGDLQLYNGNLVGNSSHTMEIGDYTNGMVKRIRMAQGGELHFGDTTTSNFLGITEGTANTFTDQDYISIYYRNSLKFFSNNNVQRLVIDSSGHFLPAVNNSVDLGSNSLRWKNMYASGIVSNILPATAATVTQAEFRNPHTVYGGGVRFKSNNTYGTVEIINYDASASASIYNSTGGWHWTGNWQTHGRVNPFQNNQHSLGTSSLRWTTVYSTGLNISGATSPATISHTGGNALTLTRNSKNLNFNANYAAANTHATIDVTSGMELRFQVAGSDRVKLDSSGHWLPTTNNARDLGSTSLRWRNVYTNDLNLSNEGSSNDVDGTWGNYTIQEGEDDLFLINRRSGKKYKFNLTEVS